MWRLKQGPRERGAARKKAAIAIAFLWIAAGPGGVTMPTIRADPAPDRPDTCLFDTGAGSPAPLSAAELTSRTGWSAVPEDHLAHRFRGDLVLCNDRLTMVLRRAGGGVEIYSRTATALPLRAVVAPWAAPGDKPPALEAVQVLENNPGTVLLAATFRSPGGVTCPLRCQLAAGQCTVEFQAGEGTHGLLVQCPARYVIVPDFFGNDMVFGPDLATRPRLRLPAENFCIGLSGQGSAAVMCVWQSSTQQATAVASGPAAPGVLQSAGAGTRLCGWEIQAARDQKVWVACLECEGFWHEQALPADAAGAPTALDWKPPFAAKWRADLLEDHGAAQSWFFRDPEDDAAAGQAATDGGSADHPCCFESGRALVRLPGTLQTAADRPSLLVYALDRCRTTPLTTYCPIDILRNTLGVGPCEYILQTEGLASDANPTPDHVMTWVEQQFSRKRQEKAAEEIRELLDQMVAHVERVQARIERYGSLARESCDLCGQPAGEQSVSADVAALRSIGESIDRHAAGFLRRRPAPAARAGQLAAQVADLTGRKDGAAACAQLGMELRAIGADADRTLANCRMAGRWLWQSAAMLSEDAPSQASLAAAVQACARKMLEIGKNLFANAGFEEGRDLWRMDVGGATVGRFTVDAQDAGAGRYSALLSLGAVDQWGIQFGQCMDAVQVGRTCTFAVLAKSVHGPVVLRLEIERRGAPYDRAAASEQFTVTADAWTELHVTFRVPKPFPQGWFAYVSCDQPDSQVRLDMFRLYEGEYVAWDEMAASEPLAAEVRLFDTGRVSASPLPCDAVRECAGWTPVPHDTTDHAFRGDAVLANNRLAVVLRRGAAGADLYAISADRAAFCAVLGPADSSSEAALTSVAVVENGPGEVVVEAGFRLPGGATGGLRYALEMGQLYVRTEPSAASPVAAVSIEAPCRFVVLPDFFADDIVVDAARLQVDSAELPSENFLLRMLPGGDAIVMSVTASRDEDARIELSGSPRDAGGRWITRSSLAFGQGGRVWVAVLAAPGIWHERDIAHEEADQIIPLEWHMPFAAQWRVDWSRADHLTDSWEMIAQKDDGQFEKYGWADAPSLIPRDRSRWTTVLGTFSYPCWLDTAGRGYVQPLGRVEQFIGPAVIYPIKRVPATPLDVFTVVDVVRATLGVGPCEYILDVEGQGSQYRGCATCGMRDALAAIYGRHQQKQKRDEIEQILRDVVVFVEHIRGRIDDYVAFGHELLAYLDRQKQDRPELAELIGEFEALARSIDEHVQARRARIKTPGYVMDLTDEFRRTLLDYDGDDALSRCNAITHAVVEVGGNQDELVGECRMVVKALRQRAGLAVAREPRAAEIAGEIRRRTQQVLRNPAVHESARH